MISIETQMIQTLRLVQALRGAVSPNFRMVALAYENCKWRLIFILEEQNPEDVDEIEEIGFEFTALQETTINHEIDLTVTKEAIPWPDGSIRVVYRRREGQ